MRTVSELKNLSWFGELPTGWSMIPIKSLFKFSKGLNITKADLIENGSQVINYGQIHSKENNKTCITAQLIRYVSEEKALSSKRALVEKGGFIFADTSEDLEGVGNFVYNDSDEKIYGGYHTIVINPYKYRNNKFFAYLFQTDAWREQLRRQLVDVKVFSINQGILSETHLAVPSYEIQTGIVNYLDLRCEQIDNSIKRHKLLIEKLNSYKLSLINHAVINGINQKETFKDSGLSYLGKIPSSWQKIPLKYLCTYNSKSLSDKTNPLFEFDYVDIGSVEFAKGITNFTRMKFCDSPSRARRLVEPKDIIISTVRTYLKAITVIPSFTFPLVVSTGFLVVSAKEDLILPEFLGYTLKSDLFTKEVEKRSYGVNYPAIKASEAVKICIAVPPIEDQRRIISFLDKKCAEIDLSIVRTQRLIETLTKYRQSLISSAVTGKLDCQGENNATC